MQHFYDNVTDQFGNAVKGASVLVQAGIAPAALTTATIYSDNGVTVKSNPLTTGATGTYDFAGANGGYTISVTAPNGTVTSSTITLFDPDSLEAPFIATGGISSASRADRAMMSLDFKLDFGGVCDGVTADAARLNAALAEVASLGVGTLHVRGNVAIDQTISHPYPNLRVLGAGSDLQHEAVANGTLARTKFIWTGAAGGTIYDMASPVGASAPVMTGGGVEGIYFDAKSVAAYGLRVRSWRKGRFADLFVDEATTADFDVNIVSQLLDNSCVQDCDFIQLGGRNQTTSGNMLRLGSDYFTTNVSLNRFWGLRARIKNGAAIALFNSDNNKLHDIVVIRGTLGTGNALEFHGSDTDIGVARANVVYGFSTNGAVPSVCFGTETYVYPSYSNAVYGIDHENGTQFPTVGTGSTMNSWSRTDGLYSIALQKTSLVKQQSDLTSFPFSSYPNASSFCINGSNGGMVWGTPNGSAVWIQFVDASTADMAFAISAGTTGYALRTPRLKVGTDTNAPRIDSGNGDPNGTVSSPVASTYWQRDDATGFPRWEKRSGTGNTGWVRVTSAFEHPGYVASNWYVPAGNSVAVTTGVAPGINKIIGFVGSIKSRLTVSALGLRISTTQAGGNVQCAVYAMNPTTRKPTGLPLITTGSMATDTAANVNAVVSGGSLNAAGLAQIEAGWYFFASNFDNATASGIALNSSGGTMAALFGSATQASSLSSGGTVVGLTAAQTFGTWPDLTSTTWTEVGTASVPFVQFLVNSVP